MRDRSWSWRHPQREEDATELRPAFLVVAGQAAGIGPGAGAVAHLRIRQLHAEVGALRDPQRGHVLCRERRRGARQPGGAKPRLREGVRRAHLTKLGETSVYDPGLTPRVEDVVREQDRILRLENGALVPERHQRRADVTAQDRVTAEEVDEREQLKVPPQRECPVRGALPLGKRIPPVDRRRLKTRNG